MQIERGLGRWWEEVPFIQDPLEANSTKRGSVHTYFRLGDLYHGLERVHQQGNLAAWHSTHVFVCLYDDIDIPNLWEFNDREW